LLILLSEPETELDLRLSIHGTHIPMPKGTLFAGNEGNEGKDSVTVTKTSTVNSVSCSSNADATAFSASKDAHVSALAEAHKAACSEKNDPKWNGSVVSVWEKGAAYAVAKVSLGDVKPAFL
jgi:hypothetical protein